MNINKIDPIYYINQLLTQLVFNITTKEAVTIFAINHSQNENPCVQTYLNYLTETYGIDESETDHIDDLLRSNDYDSLSKENKNLFSEFLKQSQKETKSSVLSSVNEFPNDIQSIIKSECSNEYIRKVSEEQSYRINNIQQAMIIMKKEVIKTQMKIRFTDLQPLNELNIIDDDIVEEEEIKDDNCFFVFQLIKSVHNQQQQNQLRDSLQPVEIYDFWDGLELKLIPKLIIVIVDGMVETLSTDLAWLQQLYPNAKMHVIYCYKKNKIQHVNTESLNNTLEFDLQVKKGEFIENRLWDRFIRYCFI